MILKFLTPSRPNLDPTVAAKLTKTKPKASSKQAPATEEAKYVGCFSSETFFVDKKYEGGSTGANYNLALHNAKVNRKKYFAIARGGEDGHSFAFSALKDKSRGDMHDGGCDRPCLDMESKSCGCMDGACTGPTPPNEEHNRRWAVYELVTKK